MSMQYVVKGDIRFSVHDLKCESCGREYKDEAVDTSNISLCMNAVKKGHKMGLMVCGGVRTIRWDLSERKSNVTLDPNITPRDRAIVYINPKTGKPAIPGQDTEFTRKKYEGWGYERREFETLRELDKFCKQEKLVNEKANFDNGNGVN